MRKSSPQLIGFVATQALIACVWLAFYLPVFARAEMRGNKGVGSAREQTNRGINYSQKKQYHKAIEEFTKAIAAQPKEPKNYENRALAYELTGRRAKALDDFSKLIELKPNDQSAYARRGQLELQMN
ncbi:MAG TPA: tetratricopeptide repeat protein, partial [Candidatus Udaeobacter sp.]